MPRELNEKFLKAVLEYGEEYQKKYLLHYSKSMIKNDSWEALKFFFDRAFYQGRLDEVSRKVEDAAISVLVKHPCIEKMDYNDRYLLKVEKDLKEVIGKGKIGKGRDIQMVISTLKYILPLPEKNLVNQSIKRIKSGCTREHYSELMGRNGGITQVGPKIASLYMRDVVSLYQLEKHLDDSDYLFLQPVDVWVQRVLFKLDLISEKPRSKEIEDALTKVVNVCLEKNYSPLGFNQGVWYFAANSFDILMDLLRK
ncbi:hypothetical protein GF338_05930 [candidate division WOR-3 bacterium]|nr:hypothetical protein [candidate division WOR-3 bacterium]